MLAFATLTLQKSTAVTRPDGGGGMARGLAMAGTNGRDDEKNLTNPLGVSLTFTTFADKNNTYGDY